MDANLLRQLQTGSPNHPGGEDVSVFPVPVLARIYPGYGNMGNIKKISMMLWDMGPDPYHAILELSRPIDTLKYPGDGKGPAEKFYIKGNTQVLTILSKKAGLPDGDQLTYIYGITGGDYNEVATLLNDADPMFGGIYLCIRNSEGRLRGIRSKELLRYVVRALDTVSDHTCFSRVAGPSEPRPTAEKLRKKHDEAMADLLEEIDHGKINSAAEALGK